MKSFIGTMIVALGAFASIQGQGPSVIQTATGHADFAPVVVVFPSTPTYHNLLVASCSLYGPISNCAAPDSTWTLATPMVSAGGITGGAVYVHAVRSGEPNSYSFGNGNHTTVIAYEIAGSKYWNPINQAAMTAVTTASLASVATPPVTPSIANTLPLAFFAGDDSTASAASSGWTFNTGQMGVNHQSAGAIHALTTNTTTPQTTTFTTSGANSAGVVVSTFLIAPNDPTPIAPVAVAPNEYSSLINIPIQFDGSGSYDVKLENLTYLWTFGDGATSTAISPAHTYTTAGTYSASLMVTNTDGLTNTVSLNVPIQAGCSGATLGPMGSLGGYQVSPQDPWHVSIASAPVDALSTQITTTAPNDLHNAPFHADFSGSYGSANFGIPYTVVDSTVTGFTPFGVRPSTGFYLESDLSSWPIPAGGLQIEGNPATCTATGDNHAIVFDRATCTLYESYHVEYCSGGVSVYPSGTAQWSGDETVVLDTTKTWKRPYAMTSVDAAGFSIFSGLIRYDEVATGVINHALRFTAAYIKQNANNGYFMYPASHSAGTNYGNDMVYGTRIRLKASVDISGYTPQAKIIAQALKTYGGILADLGSNMYFTGTPDSRWNDTDIATLAALHASDFEVVTGPGASALASTYTPGTAPFYPNGSVYDALNHPTGAVPTNSLAASANAITAGQSVTLTPTSSANASYSFIDKLGLVRGPVTVTPTTTTTYTMTSSNPYAVDSSGNFIRPTSSQTITVNSAPPTAVGLTITGGITISGAVVLH